MSTKSGIGHPREVGYFEKRCADAVKEGRKVFWNSAAGKFPL